MCVGGRGGGVAHYSCCSVFQTFTNFGIVLMEANSPPLSLSPSLSESPPPPLLSFSEFVLSVDVSENVIVKSQSGGGGGLICIQTKGSLRSIESDIV